MQSANRKQNGVIILIVGLALAYQIGAQTFSCNDSVYKPLCPGTSAVCVCVVTGVTSYAYWNFINATNTCTIQVFQLKVNPTCDAPLGNCGPYLKVGHIGLECNSSVLYITADVSQNGMVIECRDLSTGDPGTLVGNTTINIVTGPPRPPIVLNVSSSGPNLLVVWSPSTTGGVPTSYNVSFNDDPNTLVPIPSGMLQHMFTGLSNVVVYNISVVAINCFGYNITSHTIETRTNTSSTVSEALEAGNIIGIVVGTVIGILCLVVVVSVILKCRICQSPAHHQDHAGEHTKTDIELRRVEYTTDDIPDGSSRILTEHNNNEISFKEAKDATNTKVRVVQDGSETDSDGDDTDDCSKPLI